MINDIYFYFNEFYNVLLGFIHVLAEFMKNIEPEYLYVSYFILFFGILQNLIYIIQVPIAFLELISSMKLYDSKEHSWHMLTSNITERISIIIPAYNESVIIKTTIHSVLSLKYPNFDIIVVNDGSNDGMLDILIEEFQLHKVDIAYENEVPCAKILNLYKSRYYNNIIVVDKENGGKADAINAGINLSRSPLFCVVDADSVIEIESLLKTMQPFIDDPQEMIAVGGMVRIGNGCTIVDGEIKKIDISNKILPLFQTVEYIRTFFMGRLSSNRLGISTIISGTFGVFQRDAVIKVNGYSLDSVGGDYDLILKLHNYFLKYKIPYKIKFVSEPVCWTEVPETMSTLKKQRVHWQQGTLEWFFKQWKMLFNPKYKKIGMIAFPSILLLDILGPIIEILGYIMIPIGFILGIIDIEILLLFFTIFVAMGVLISVLSIILEEISLSRFITPKNLFVIGMIAILENFGYRQITNFWRINGWIKYLIRNKNWEDSKRKGFTNNL